MHIKIHSTYICNFQISHLKCTCTNHLCQFKCFEICRISTQCWNNLQMLNNFDTYWIILQFIEKLTLLNSFDLMLNTKILLMKGWESWRIWIYYWIVLNHCEKKLYRCWKQSKTVQNQSGKSLSQSNRSGSPLLFIKIPCQVLLSLKREESQIWLIQLRLEKLSL